MQASQPVPLKFCSCLLLSVIVVSSSEVWLRSLLSSLKQQKLVHFLRVEPKMLEINIFILHQEIAFQPWRQRILYCTEKLPFSLQKDKKNLLLIRTSSQFLSILKKLVSRTPFFVTEVNCASTPSNITQQYLNNITSYNSHCTTVLHQHNCRKPLCLLVMFTRSMQSSQFFLLSHFLEVSCSTV